jgi:hypothetical protein
MRRGRQRQGRPTLPLRVATHNVHGLTSPQNVNSLLRCWAACTGGVVTLPSALTSYASKKRGSICQATAHNTRLQHGSTVPARTLHLLAWNWHLPCAYLHLPIFELMRHHAGAAIIQMGAIPGLSIHLAHSGAHPSGRMLHCIVVWGDHCLSLINKYWPIGPLPSGTSRSRFSSPTCPTACAPAWH